MPLLLFEGPGAPAAADNEALQNTGSTRARGPIQTTCPTTSLLLRIPKIHPNPHPLDCTDRDHRKDEHTVMDL